jgi:putative sterol carrier protein
MRDGGIEPEILFLKDYKINPCIGCYTCWSKTPGVCIHKDDMASLLDKLKAVDLVIYAQPLYVFTVPGITKNFLDRQIPLLEPFLIERPDGSTGHPNRYKDDNRGRMLLFSVCGFPEKDHFKAMVEMFRLMSRAGGRPLIGEILRPSSESMRFGERMGGNYEMAMDALYRAGKEVTSQGYVSTATEDVISSPFLPDVHSFRALGNRFWNTWIEYEKQKKAGRDLPDLEAYLSSDAGMYFAGMAAMYDPAKAGDFEGTFQFNINGGRKGTYCLEIKDHQCIAREGEASRADLVIHTPLEVWTAIGQGEISGQEALMQGKYRVEGDLGLLIRMGEIFSA